MGDNDEMKRRTLLSLLILTVAVGAPVATQWQINDNSLAKRTRIDELKALLEKDAVIVVDVRGDETYRMGHIPGSVSISLETVAERAGELRGATKPIVTYCT